jgi:hypothetical protein
MNNNGDTTYYSLNRNRNRVKYNTAPLQRNLDLDFPQENIFSSVSRRDRNSKMFITNENNDKEILEFLQCNQYISLKIGDNKRIFDLFEIYKNSETIKINKKKSLFKRMFEKLFS